MRLLLAVAVAGALACSAAPPRRADRPPVIVYLIDALRPDHLGLYGYSRDTSPNLDRLAEDAVVFDDAYTPAPWTKPATTSLLTGVNPPRHGVQARRHHAPEEFRLLSEYLKDAGYVTAGVVTNPHVSEHWGFARGYDRYDDLAVGLEQWERTGADEVNVRVFEHLARDARSSFFYYIHTIDPHGPNDPEPPYDTLFVDEPHEVPLPAKLSADTPPEVIEMMRRLYDAEIYYNDLHFGELVERLKLDGLYDDAMIVVVSDHGEEHMEHGRGGHGKQLFQELVRIPMLIKFPGNEFAGTRVARRSSLIDIVPTVLGVLGLPSPPELEGIDLRALLSDNAAVEQRTLFFDLNQVRPDGVLHVSRAVISGGYKYIEELLPERRRWLFDLGEDPQETRNLIDRDAQRAAEMAQLIEAYEAAASDAAVPEELRERLRALGYIN